MRDRKLTGPWAGFSFKGGRLVSPEGREYLPEDLAWLSLTVAQAQEWRRMMDGARSSLPGHKARKALRHNGSEIVDLQLVVRMRNEKRSPRVMAGPDADPPMAAGTTTGPKPRARV